MGQSESMPCERDDPMLKTGLNPYPLSPIDTEISPLNMDQNPPSLSG